MFKIIGIMNGREAEELDTAETEKEANYLRNEYALAFGAGWTIYIEAPR